MLSLPCIVERPATPYVALRKDVTLPFDDEIPAILAQLSAYLAQRGLEATGPVFFKHNVVDMPHLQMEFGVPLAHPVEAGGEFTVARASGCVATRPVLAGVGALPVRGALSVTGLLVSDTLSP